MKILYITFCAVLLDTVTKLLVKGFSFPLLGIQVSGMTYGSSVPLLGNFFRLTFVENPGMAFGIDIVGKVFLALFSIFAAIGIFYYLYKIRKESLWLRLPFAFILAGAIGNLINRVFFGVLFGYAPLLHGNVVDFIDIDIDFFDFQILGYSMSRWPVFNLADVAVTIGVTMLLVSGKNIHINESNKIIENNE